MTITAILLVCCALAGAAAGQGVPCTFDEPGTSGECRPIGRCPALLRIALTARPSSPAVKRLRELVKRCPRTASGDIQICCQSQVTRAVLPPRIELPTEEQCGQQFNPRVTGGEDATIGEFPWMASIQYAKSPGAPLEHGCGGTLITSRHVLTAAHCVTFLSTQQFPELEPVAVVLGELDFNSERDCLRDMPTECSDQPITVEIDRIFAHPDFHNVRAQALPHDIAVLRLAREVTFTDYIRPICLLTDLSVLRAGRTDLSSWSERRGSRLGTQRCQHQALHACPAESASADPGTRRL